MLFGLKAKRLVNKIMLSKIFRDIEENKLAIIIGIVFFTIPFFWFKPGTMDLGGDATRLYFYDPQAFIKNAALYTVGPHGKGDLDPRQSYLVYVGLLAFIKNFVGSGHNLISMLNGITLSIGFLSIYFIVKEFIQADIRKRILSAKLAAIVAGFFYIIVTGSQNYIFFWVKALHSHEQIFLNPLMFFLLLRFLLTRNNLYLLGALFVSFLFSVNFAMISAPPPFAFYPIAIIFLLLYVSFVRGRKIFVKDLIVGVLLFLGLQMFHLLPEIASLFDKGSISNNIVFSGSAGEGINFFNALLPNGMASMSLLLPPPTEQLRWLSFIAPLIILLGFLFQREKSKELLLTSLFFLITLFLVSANVTDIGISIYRFLFHIPGFSMFRHFFYQWAYIFMFFYAILFGLTLSLILSRVKKKYMVAFFIGILIIFVVGFWEFLNGKLLDGLNVGTNNVKTAMIMPPAYETTLNFIKKLPDDGKILILPLSDNFNQVIYDSVNNSAYVGPSSISILTGKRSFAGEQIFFPFPMNEHIKRFAREKNYEALTQIFSVSNIRYIFYNSDPNAFEKNFSIFPFFYIKQYFPKTQEEYKNFIKKFSVKLIYENGPYQIFEFDKRVYRPEVYIPDSIYKFEFDSKVYLPEDYFPDSVYKDEMIDAIRKHVVSYQSAFIDSNACQKNKIMAYICRPMYEPPKVKFTMKKINPTAYEIHVQQSETKSPFLLVFQNTFHQGWKLSLDQNKPFNEDKHISVNKYANAWVISADDRKGKNDYTLYLNLETQKFVWYGFWITGSFLIIFVVLIVKSITSKKN